MKFIICKPVWKLIFLIYFINKKYFIHTTFFITCNETSMKWDAKIMFFKRFECSQNHLLRINYLLKKNKCWSCITCNNARGIFMVEILTLNICKRKTIYERKKLLIFGCNEIRCLENLKCKNSKLHKNIYKRKTI